MLSPLRRLPIRLPQFVCRSFLPVFLFSCAGDFVERTGDQPFSRFATEIEHATFVDPPPAYRSFPFYSLNDKLGREEIGRQVEEFSRAGYGGFYLHARTGLLTPYMGEDWWDAIGAAVDAAAVSNLYAWFYDEYNWPSGYAGGMVPRKGPEYRAKCLVRLDRETLLPEGSTVLREDNQFRYVEYTMQMGNPVFYGSAYADLLDPRAVDAFIRTSYDPYTERYESSSGAGVRGIFTDEPHIHARYFDRSTPHRGVLSYSPSVATRYKVLTGHDLVDDLEGLFEEKANWREVRLHYYRAVAGQFEMSFSRRISRYCAERGYIFTGHYLGEDVLEKVRDRIGNAMLHYRNMQQPGMDHLGLTIENRLITARSLSSAANQYDRPRRLSELFGISGQNMSYEDRKWIAGWHAILGVNHFCPHLTLYSMAGLRKRDYPPTFSYHQPYWKYNKAIEDYLGRISYAASTGRYDPQFLMINPLESEYIKGRNDGEFSTGLLALMEAMQSAHYDYDLGDEQILADTAEVTDGRLRVGAMQYAHVILPDMIGIRESTLDLLLQLSGAGGKLFNTGRFPEYVDGKKAPEKLKVLRAAATDLDIDDLPESLPPQVEPSVSLSGEGTHQVWTQVRLTGDGPLILLYNSSHTQAVRFRLRSPMLGEKVLLWDPSDAGCYPMPDAGEEGYSLEIAPSSLIWLNSPAEIPAGAGRQYALPSERDVLLSLPGPWKGKRLQPNAITLDFACFSIDGGENFSDPEPVIGIISRLTDQAYSGPLLLKYPFQITRVPENCRLVIEDPGIFNRILVNGQPVEFEDGDWYLDRQFPLARIGGFLLEGTNEIEMELDFIPPVPGSETDAERYGTEIESIYLVGDFGVEGLDPETSLESQRNQTGYFIPRPVHGFTGFTLTAEKQVFEGNLTLEGYPFYAGEFELLGRFTIDTLAGDKRYFLELPNAEAIVIGIELNGNPAGRLYWSPFRCDITDLLKTGENTLKFTLVSSLRNLLGPHHHPGAELTRVGPNSFTGAGGFPDPRGDPYWYESRKKGEDLRLWTDTYWHIPFGFLEPPVISVGK